MGYSSQLVLIFTFLWWLFFFNHLWDDLSLCSPCWTCLFSLFLGFWDTWPRNFSPSQVSWELDFEYELPCLVILADLLTICNLVWESLSTVSVNYSLYFSKFHFKGLWLGWKGNCSRFFLPKFLKQPVIELETLQGKHQGKMTMDNGTYH